MESTNSIQVCPHCQNLVPPNSNFCPYCGQVLKKLPPSTSIIKQLGLYALSLFLPPLGLWPAFKYLRSEDPAAKRVGLICVILTVLSLILTIYTASAVLNSFTSQFSNLTPDSLSY